MIRLFTLVACIVLCCTIDISAQITDLLKRNTNYLRAFPGSKIKVDGCPFLNKEWLPSIIDAGDDRKMSALARYRVHGDELEVFHKDRVFALDKSLIRSIKLGNRSFIVCYALKKNKEIPTKTYLEVVSKGRVNLLLRYGSYIQEGKSDRGLIESIDAQLVIKRSYYILRANSDIAFEIKRNKKHILNLFGEKALFVKKYIKDNRLSYKDIKDLNKIFNYYNNLEKKTSITI